MFVRCLPASAVNPLNLSAGLRYIRPQSTEVANYTVPDPSEGPVSEPIPKQVLSELAFFGIRQRTCHCCRRMRSGQRHYACLCCAALRAAMQGEMKQVAGEAEYTMDVPQARDGLQVRGTKPLWALRAVCTEHCCY